MKPIHLLVAVAIIAVLAMILRRFVGGASMEAIQNAKGRGATLLDVRTPAEFADGHAPGSLNIPLDQLPFRCKELDRSKPILVGCAVGGRAGQAKAFLEREGFTEVINVGSWRGLM
jgi:phage shock protein E